MMMSVFRQGRPRAEVDHLALINTAASADDISLITWASVNPKPVLASYDDAAAVVKNLEAGDDGLSFETLYDDSLTLHDMRRMRAHQVDSPDHLHPGLYQARLIFDFSFRPTVVVRFKAMDDRAARSVLGELLDGGDFREQIVVQLAHQIFSSDEVSALTTGCLKIEDIAPSNAPEWEIVNTLSRGD